jgi:hypothetical protein
VLDLCSVPPEDGDGLRAPYNAAYRAARDATDPTAIAAFVAVLRGQWGVLDGGMAPTADAPALADPLVATIETLEQHRQRHATRTPWAPALADPEEGA